jgi:hypothetical protein
VSLSLSLGNTDGYNTALARPLYTPSSARSLFHSLRPTNRHFFIPPPTTPLGRLKREQSRKQAGERRLRARQRQHFSKTAPGGGGGGGGSGETIDMEREEAEQEVLTVFFLLLLCPAAAAAVLFSAALSLSLSLFLSLFMSICLALSHSHYLVFLTPAPSFLLKGLLGIFLIKRIFRIYVYVLGPGFQ